jgi:hypothetical protein
MISITASGMDIVGPGGGPDIPIVGRDQAVGSMTLGSYSYKVSYITWYGETLCGPSTAVYTTANGSIKISNIPTHPRNFAIGRKLYRTSVGNVLPYRLIATMNDNILTTYTDISNDTALGAVEPNKNTASSIATERGWVASSKPQVHAFATITAAGITLATATEIGFAEYALVATPVNLNGIRLSPLTSTLPGLKITIKNTSLVNDLYVYPFEVSNTINALGAGAPFLLAADTTQDFMALTSTGWITVTGGAGGGGGGVSTWAGGTTGLTPAAATAGPVTLGGTLGVANGGTGAVTLAPGGVIYGNGTSAVGVSVGTPGQLLTSGGAGAPTWSAITISGGTLTGIPTPIGSTDVANKSYVDATASGFNVHDACLLATTATLSGTYFNGVSGVGATLTNNGALAALVVDSVAVSVGNRILVRAQASPVQNGVYVVTTVGNGATAWVLTRSADFDNSPAGEVKSGDFIFITAGTQFTATGWVQVTIGTGPGGSITIGTDPLVFTQFSSAGTYLAGTGLNLLGNTFSNTGVLSVSGGTTGLTFSPSTGNAILGGTLSVANGGTGLTTLTSGGVLYASSTSTTTTTALGATGQIIISNGTVPTFQTLSGDVSLTSGGVVNVNRLTGAAGAGGTGMRVASDASSVYIGYTAAIPTGTQNTGYGAGALNIATVGGNTGIGSGAGSAINSGTNNTIIGATANAGATSTGSIAVGFGATAAANNVTVIGDSSITANTAGGLYLRHRGPAAFTVNVAGFIAGTSELVEVSSSIRTKENVRDLEQSTLFEKLRPVRYTPKLINGLTELDVRENIGFIAEEVVDLYPEVVTFDIHGAPAGLMYDRLVPVLVKQVQTLRSELVALCAIVDELRAKK